MLNLIQQQEFQELELLSRAQVLLFQVQVLGLLYRPYYLYLT